MRKRPADPGMNMTPMIDIVFQLIIFFILTVDMNNKSVDERIKLAMAPHGKAVEKKDPRELNIDISSDGRVMINRLGVTRDFLRDLLVRTFATPGGASTPIIIRADGQTPHEYVRSVMDDCASKGFWRIKFGAIKQKAPAPQG